VLERLGQRVRRLSGLPRPDAGWQCPSYVVRGVPVVSEPPQVGAAGAALVLDPCFERASVRGMQRRPLNRQQIVVDRLLHQRVPEGIGVTAGLRYEDVVGDRLAEQLN
jgi:hypothetical protein